MGAEYEKIYDFKNLCQAFKETASCKRSKKEVVEFELDIAKSIWSLHDELESKTYKPSGYRRFNIYDPKFREIQALSFRDRVVQHCLCKNVIKPYFEPRLVYDCAACRELKGTHFAMDRLSGFLRDFYKKHGTKGYFLKCDVRKYFDSVDHDVLKNIIAKFPDKDVLDLIHKIIDSYNKDTGVGLPMGNQTSQWFSLYYLDRLDRIIKEKFRIKYYTRYMDDLVLIHEDKSYLRKCLGELERVAKEERKLEFNQKTQIFPIPQGVDYLGWRFYLNENGRVIKRLRTSNKKRFKRRMKSFMVKYQTGEKTLEDIKCSMASYRGHLCHGDTWHLRENVYNKFVLKKPED